MKDLINIKTGVTLQEIKPNLFILKFNSRLEMAYSFLRYQEYYESPNPNFKNKLFRLDGAVIEYSDGKKVWYYHG